MTLNHYIGRDKVLKLIGALNLRFKCLHSVFICYPASEEYTLAYAYKNKLHLQTWTPWLVGVYKQNGKWGLMFTISSVETDFLDPANIDNIKALLNETISIQNLVYAKQKTFAGILPGVMYAKRILRETTEVDVTVEALKKAIASVLSANAYHADTPIIVLGGHGFVGRRLLKKLDNNDFYSIDLHNHIDFPSHLIGKNALLINISRKAAIKDYIWRFWKELIVLNEVYPEPSPEEIDLITERGSRIYHIVGVKATAYPAFPNAYEGGIPCCAAWNSGDKMDVLLRKMN